MKERDMSGSPDDRATDNFRCLAIQEVWLHKRIVFVLPATALNGAAEDPDDNTNEQYTQEYWLAWLLRPVNEFDIFISLTNIMGER